MADWTIVSRDTQDSLGEGALWSARANAFFWVDILAPALNRLSLADGQLTRWPMPEPIGWVAERAGGGFIAGFQGGFAELDLDPLSIRPIGDPEPDLPGNRMNDGKADAAGNIWCGTMDMAEEQDSGTFYRLAPDLRWARMDGGYRVPNGPAFSADGRWLYHSDTARRTVYRYRRLPDGGIADRTPFITFTAADGYPDGMTVDAANGLWIAHWGGARISRFHEDGTLDRAIPLPAQQITNIAFAGPSLDRMFVTSAATGLPPTPMDGALFEMDAGAIGLPPGLFAG
ncbi:SMP-30/gluconolactonase/LRE family protein [Sphingomonas solaris]|uniref:SMP-30/gluconolactonase/LRE family protein n=1 Tax=Alterirhizorhabdus solaris TaxID=2529389 RepID=A0A558R101_9SPHN|nr:SMP-30/gluconolactonase/LRE family protein [Sphingomonas solaris]TVV73012.1 SMP-30/gluconolactonase/LRE family protein [Sphingomonas solaris]